MFSYRLRAKSHFRSFLAYPVLAIIALLTSCQHSPGTTEPTSVSSLEKNGDPQTPTADTETEQQGALRAWAGEIPAPEFPTGLEWLNIAQPLSLEGLRGKVVLLDFWTYGCINCIHNIPHLQQLAREFSNELVIIGVHSAKFANEGETENLRKIILRYELEHPVVNDKDFLVWSLWGPRAWPTLVLVDPAGNIVGGHTGEGFYPTFRVVIASLLREFADKVDPSPLDLKLEQEGIPETVLSFPGKVLADEEGGRLFISDAGHHRIVVADIASGKARLVIGKGSAGYRDGDSGEAMFNNPQGLALSTDGQTLFVADTGNHAIRRVDLASGHVGTLAGTGVQPLDYPPPSGVIPDVALSSPWDLVVIDNDLYMAMAGTHQIWSINLDTGLARTHAGSGLEGTVDSPLDAAELAQPSGLTFDGADRLYFADSEGSAIRFSDISVGGRVGTIAGSGQSLFDFGDIDGLGREARFQHPLGVVHHEGILYVTDTYNHKIKMIDLETSEVSTFAGKGRGWNDGFEPLFYEPGGISVAGDRLYVADTNNHSIRSIDLASGRTSTLLIWGIDAVTVSEKQPYSGETIRLEPVRLASGAGRISLDVILPDGHKVTTLAPSSVRWKADGNVAVLPSEADQYRPGLEFPLTVAGVRWEDSGILLADIHLLYCEELRENLCFIERVRLEIPIEVTPNPDSASAEGADNNLTLSHKIKLKTGNIPLP